MNGVSSPAPNNKSSTTKGDEWLQSIILSLAALSPLRQLKSLNDINNNNNNNNTINNIPFSSYTLNDWDLLSLPNDRSIVDEQVDIVKSIIRYEAIINSKANIKIKEKAKYITEDTMNVLLKMLAMCFPSEESDNDPIFVSSIDGYRKALGIKALCSTFAQAAAIKPFRDWLFRDSSRYREFVSFITSMWHWICAVSSDSFKKNDTKSDSELLSDRSSTVNELIQWTTDLMEVLFNEEHDEAVSELQKPLLPLMIRMITQQQTPKCDLFLGFKQIAFTTATQINVYSIEFIKETPNIVSLLRGVFQSTSFDDLTASAFVFRVSMGILREVEALNDDRLQRLVEMIVVPHASDEARQKLISFLQFCSENANEESGGPEFIRFIHEWMQINQDDLFVNPSMTVMQCEYKTDEESEEPTMLFLFKNSFVGIHPASGENQFSMESDEFYDYNKKDHASDIVIEVEMKKMDDENERDEKVDIIFKGNESHDDHWSKQLIQLLDDARKMKEQKKKEEVSDIEPDYTTDDDDERPTTPVNGSSFVIKNRGGEIYTDDEADDEGDDDDTTPPVPRFNEKKPEKLEEKNDDNQTKKKAAPSRSSKEKKNGDKNEEKDPYSFTGTEENHSDDEDNDDEASMKKPSKKSKISTKKSSAPSKSSKKGAKEENDEEKKTDQIKPQRSMRSTAKKANEKIRQNAKIEQRGSDDDEEEKQTQAPLKGSRSSTITAPKNDQKIAAEKKMPTIKEKKIQTTISPPSSGNDHHKHKQSSNNNDIDVEEKTPPRSTSSMMQQAEIDHPSSMPSMYHKHRSLSKSSAAQTPPKEVGSFTQAPFTERIKWLDKESATSAMKIHECVAEVYRCYHKNGKAVDLIMQQLITIQNLYEGMANGDEGSFKSSDLATHVQQITNTIMDQSNTRKRKPSMMDGYDHDDIINMNISTNDMMEEDSMNDLTPITTSNYHNKRSRVADTSSVVTNRSFTQNQNKFSSINQPHSALLPTIYDMQNNLLKRIRT